ncbi:MAG: chemotaxis protein CheW [Hydrogenophaga sp.]|jgi:twitching motility protein PilI|uniref:chemotaxis protein CheW n=1 Tax=Hydrogenophaga sp. TaxID=1904254 RepID=UPI002619A1C4|nr:chemotaxis protein CheW [Hydrogenophaga sp.]MCV0441038.1 chemotaxis protein CheW [Hydrogenophaga sp.]
MAKRQSLKELQERLAQRLTAAKTEAVTATWLAVEASGRPYLLPLVQSGEIFPWSPLQRVPYTKPWYAGVASLRGGLHGVIDLARLVDAATGAPALPATERVTSESRLISLHAALGVNAVIWIDRLLGLRNPAMFSAIGTNPEGAPSYFTRSLVDLQGQAWQELDLQSLVAEPEFLAIAA